MRIVDSDYVLDTIRLLDMLSDEGKILAKYVYNTIHSAPTINAIPVVRCEQCKHFFSDDNGHVVIERCELCHEDMRPDFYCADGERMEEENAADRC